MGINPKALAISLSLSICISAGILLLFSRGKRERTHAEAAARPAFNPAKAEQDPEPPEDDVRRRLEQRIQAIADNLVTPSGHPNQRALRALRAQGPAVVPILLDRFTGEETPIQEALLTVLEGFDEAKIAEQLLNVLESDVSPEMAAKIGAAIRGQDDTAICERLERMVTSSKPAVRLGAAIALRTCSAGSGALALVRLLKIDENEEVRVHALASLEESHDVFLEQALRFALSDASPRVRLEAVRTVERHRLVAFSEELRTLLKHDPHPPVKRAARRTLGALR